MVERAGENGAGDPAMSLVEGGIAALAITFPSISLVWRFHSGALNFFGAAGLGLMARIGGLFVFGAELAIRLPSPRRALMLFTNMSRKAKTAKTSYHES